jgi:small subunit ribosomal protein S17
MSKKKLVGIVVSIKMNKTITVVTQRRYQHAKYGKTLIVSKRYLVHDEQNQAKIGDLIILEAHAPYSRCKTWLLKHIINVGEKI